MQTKKEEIFLLSLFLLSLNELIQFHSNGIKEILKSSIKLES